MSTRPLGPSGDIPHISDLGSLEKKPPSPLKKAKSSISGLIKSESFILTPSMRSLPVLAVSAPLRIGSGLVKGISSMVKRGSIEAFTDTFSVEIGKLKLQAKGGISDYYRSLKPGNEKAKEIAANNYRYVGILNHQDLNEDFEEAAWECTFIGETANESIDENLQPAINNFVSKIKEMGFKEAHMQGHPAFYDPETGVILKLAVDSEKKELVVAFFGFGNEFFLKSPPDDKQQAKPLNQDIKNKVRSACLKHIVLESLGEVEPGAKQAVKIGKLLKACSKETGFTPVVTGHSHGGGLAQCAAVTSEIKGVVFNSRPMGNGMRRRIGQDRIARNASHVTAFSGKGDWLERTRGINMMATFFERTTGIMVPRTVGKGYNLPKAPDDGENIQHNLFQEQLKVILEGE